MGKLIAGRFANLAVFLLYLALQPPAPTRPALAVGAHLVTGAAGVHMAPGPRAVFRVIVEGPLASFIPARLQPPPGSIYRRPHHGGEHPRHHLIDSISPPFGRR